MKTENIENGKWMQEVGSEEKYIIYNKCLMPE